MNLNEYVEALEDEGYAVEIKGNILYVDNVRAAVIVKNEEIVYEANPRMFEQIF